MMTAARYFELHDAFHDELKRARHGIQHEAYGFPLMQRDGVCASHPDMTYASGIVIDNLPLDLFQKDVLDVGCGTGVISIATAYRGATVVACDNSRKATNLTAENLLENPRIQDQVIVIESDLFEGLKKAMPDQRFDFVLANLWFPESANDNADSKRQAIRCYHDYFNGVCGLLKTDGVACLTSSAAADKETTREIMREAGIKPHITSAHKQHFQGQAAMGWHLYSFDRNGNPAPLNRGSRLKPPQGLPARQAHL